MDLIQTESQLNPIENELFSKITKELRCVVCQNQSIFDSRALMALSLRHEIAEQIKEGQPESAIIEFVVQRYGPEILYNPPFQVDTALLWAGPVLMLTIGVLLFYKIGLKKFQTVQKTPL
jgi:cytochrome c-type biogenesis protein CcmH